MGKDGRDAVGQHRGDDIGVVDLFAADLVACHQIQELFCHRQVVIGDIELFQKLFYLDQNRLFRHCAEGLWPGQGG